MDFQKIERKTPCANMLTTPPHGLYNTSQNNPKPHNGDPDSPPELTILNNQLSYLTMPLTKISDRHKTAEEEKTNKDRHLLIYLIQRESEIKHEQKQANFKVANALKHLICKSGEPKTNSNNMTQVRKSSINKNHNYTINLKCVKVNDVMRDVIECKLQVL